MSISDQSRSRLRAAAEQIISGKSSLLQVEMLLQTFALVESELDNMSAGEPLLNCLATLIYQQGENYKPRFPVESLCCPEDPATLDS